MTNKEKKLLIKKHWSISSGPKISAMLKKYWGVTEKKKEDIIETAKKIFEI